MNNKLSKFAYLLGLCALGLCFDAFSMNNEKEKNEREEDPSFNQNFDMNFEQKREEDSSFNQNNDINSEQNDDSKDEKTNFKKKEKNKRRDEITFDSQMFFSKEMSSMKKEPLFKKIEEKKEKENSTEEIFKLIDKNLVIGSSNHSSPEKNGESLLNKLNLLNLEEKKDDSLQKAQEHWKAVEKEIELENKIEQKEKNKEIEKESKKKESLLEKKQREERRKQKSSESSNLLKQQIKEKAELFAEKLKSFSENFQKKNEENPSNLLNNDNLLANENNKKKFENKAEQKQPQKLSKNKKKKLKKQAKKLPEILDYEKCIKEIRQEASIFLDKEKIDSLLEKADNNDKRALLLLGIISNDIDDSGFDFISLAADWQEPFAVLLKANYLYAGTKYCKQNFKEASKLFSWLIDNDYNYDVAISHLGKIYFMDVIPGENNEKKAFELYSRLENYEKTDAFVLNDLGSLYFDGICTKQDVKKGMEFFKKSCQMGDPHGMKYFGIARIKNSENEEEKEEGFKILLELAEKHKSILDGTACKLIAKMYEKKKNFELAKNFYKKAIVEYEKESAENSISGYNSRLFLIKLYINSDCVKSIYGEKKCYENALVLSEKLKKDCNDYNKDFAKEVKFYIEHIKKSLNLINSKKTTKKI